MENQKKQTGFFGKHAKSSAALISLAIHVGILIASVTLVTVHVLIKEELTFVPKPVTRPSMPLKKLQAPINLTKKRAHQPKLRQNIVAKTKVKSMDIKLPEIVGVKGGLGGDGGGGFGSIGFSLEEIDLFGAKKGSGNELEGTFLDLKLKADGSPAEMDEEIYREVMRDFIQHWNIERFKKKYFAAPKKRFATTFMLPAMSAMEAPKAYGVAEFVKPMQWMAYYEGVISAPKSGRYRFWGVCDDVLMVRIKKKLVIDANRRTMGISDWNSTAELDKKYSLSDNQLRVGDWFYLQEDQPSRIEVLIGERPGGAFLCQLLIEQEGADYPEGKDGRPLLPIFKTRPIPAELIPMMRLEPGTCTPEGPSFGVIQ